MHDPKSVQIVSVQRNKEGQVICVVWLYDNGVYYRETVQISKATLIAIGEDK